MSQITKKSIRITQVETEDARIYYLPSGFPGMILRIIEDPTGPQATLIPPNVIPGDVLMTRYAELPYNDTQTVEHLIYNIKH